MHQEFKIYKGPQYITLFLLQWKKSLKIIDLFNVGMEVQPNMMYSTSMSLNISFNIWF